MTNRVKTGAKSMATGEPAWVIKAVTAQTGLPKRFITTAILDLHHVIDRMVADDVTVIVPPLFFHRVGDPVYAAIQTKLSDPDWPFPDDLTTMGDDALAAAFEVDEDLIRRYPVAWPVHVLVDLIDHRRLPDDDRVVEDLEAVMFAWLDTFEPDEFGNLPHPYRVSQVGRERDFEDWLVDHLDALNAYGYPVELYRRQWHHAGGVADLVCRFTRDGDGFRSGDWLIVENKATMVGAPALAQVQRYVQAATAQLATDGARVFGLLLADGATVELDELLPNSGIGYLSLAALGYRDFVRSRPRNR